VSEQLGNKKQPDSLNLCNFLDLPIAALTELQLS